MYLAKGEATAATILTLPRNLCGGSGTTAMREMRFGVFARICSVEQLKKGI